MLYINQYYSAGICLVVINDTFSYILLLDASTMKIRYMDLESIHMTYGARIQLEQEGDIYWQCQQL